MSKKVLLLHGWGGSDYPHWQSWLASELVKDYGKVSFFKFSNFEEPKLDVWIRELQCELEDFKPDIVICHSLANTLWFHMCNNKIMNNIKYLYLVAPPSLHTNIEELSEFFPVEPPKSLHADNAFLVASTNDQYMDVKELKELQSELGLEMKLLENAGHINAESEFGEWNWILEKIQAIKL